MRYVRNVGRNRIGDEPMQSMGAVVLFPDVSGFCEAQLGALLKRWASTGHKSQSETGGAKVHSRSVAYGSIVVIFRGIYLPVNQPFQLVQKVAVGYCPVVQILAEERTGPLSLVPLACYLSLPRTGRPTMPRLENCLATASICSLALNPVYWPRKRHLGLREKVSRHDEILPLLPFRVSGGKVKHLCSPWQRNTSALRRSLGQ
jgi:hypothetical protein